MIDWPDIRAVIHHWLSNMALVTGWFVLCNLVCSLGSCSSATASGMNLLGLLALTFVGLRAATGLMRVDSRLLFTPLVGYALASALFFGFGPMSTFLASDLTLRFQASSVYALGPSDVLRTNLLSSVGLTISLAAILATVPRAVRRLKPRPVLTLRTVAVLFLVFGLALKHLVIMPSIYGTSNFPVPGMVRNLRYLPDIGFALAATIAASGNRNWTLLFWLIWPWHLLLAFPELSKKSVMITIMLPAFGAYIGHRSFKRLALWLIFAALLFVSLQNLNAISRWDVHEAESYNEALGVQERFEILANAQFSGIDPDMLLPVAKVGVETWWLRLNFSGPQSVAMELYDSGLSSTFTQNILIYAIPRILWPDKPSIVSPGQEFHSIVTGNANTRTKVGITVFADGYWKMGWVGLALWASILGGVFGMISRMSMTQLARARYLYLPAALLGMQMGLTGTTAFLQNAIISGLPVYFGYCGVVFLIYQLMLKIAAAQSIEKAQGPLHHAGGPIPL